MFKFPKKIPENLVFDLGNVLVDVDYRRFTDFMGWSFDDFMRFYATDFFREFETGKQNETACFRKMAKYVPLKSEDIPRYRKNIFRTFPLRQKTLEFLPGLRKKFKLYLFSNTNSLDFNAISRHLDFPSLFDGIYTSHEQGFLKPQPEAYQKVETMFGIDPGRILYFDDRRENIDAAAERGWNVLLVNEEEKLLKILKELLEPTAICLNR